MRTTTSTFFFFLAFLAFQQNSYCCSWADVPFCQTIQHEDTTIANIIIVSGVVSQSDNDGVDFDVREVIGGVESRSTLRIWDGTDFDCNGLHSMAAADFLKVGDSLVIMLPRIDSIENTWDQLGDYRMPFPYGGNPFLKIENGIVKGKIIGNYRDDHRVTELPYSYFAKEFLESSICGLALPNLSVSFFYDEDQDGFRDNTETYLPIGNINIPDVGRFENFKHTGIFIYAPEEKLTIEFESTADWTTSVANTFEIEIQEGRSFSLSIGLVPTRNYTNIVSNISHWRFRCGEEIPFQLTFTNEGTASKTGHFWFKIDNRLDTYSFQEEPDFVDKVEGIFGWAYEDLGAFESLSIPLTITAPIIADPDQLFEIYYLKLAEDVNDFKKDPWCHEVELRCAFDPNDKQAFPLREDKLALISAPLTYTIRFQNTGNDYARSVIITDTLDQALDLSTFKLVSSSHERQLTISTTEGYDKKFEFTNIFLPDSLSDEPNSHGYLTFTISAKENIAIDTKIDNTASIYFDFNPAIITNTVSRTMVDKFPVSNLVDLPAFDLSFSPNPATDRLTFNQEVDRILLYDLSGRLVKSASQSSSLSIASLDEGMYLMQLAVAKHKTTKRVVIVR